MKCCFFGHRKLLNSNSIRERLKNTIIELIKYGCKDFSMGNHGDFDKLALSVCREIRNTYKEILVTVVCTSLAIFNKKRYGDYVEKSWAELYYSDIQTITYPIEEEYPKRQIIVNNRYMVDNADIIICYIDETKKQSGAKRAVDYAKKQNKQIINIYKEYDNPFYGRSKEEINKNYREMFELFSLKNKDKDK